MIAGLSGSLLSHDALRQTSVATDVPIAATHRRFKRWHAAVVRELGPTASARVVYDRVAEPLGTLLGFRVVAAPSHSAGSEDLYGLLWSANVSVAAILVTAWGRDASSIWRDGVRHCIGHGLRWCICLTGPAIRIFDAERTYSRRVAQFELELTLGDPVAFALFWSLLNAAAFADAIPALDRAVAMSDAHRAHVRASLQKGVHHALTHLVNAFATAPARRVARHPMILFEESLMVVYRILFLLFAEARGLVPKWHPVYRTSYTIESLRESTERLLHPPGLWESLQAISRLAHHGCRAGTLTVPPFNGRLFSPAQAPLAESLALDDGAVREAMVALTTRVDRQGRQRIAYGDLGVEQLGGIYERVLDYAPEEVAGGRRRLFTLAPVGQRKATGTFYTPRAFTEFLVRRTLAPLVAGSSADAILALRVLDPSMGSGAFLVAACRYLAHAYELALVRDGRLSEGGVEAADRAAFRRTIAQRCLFGVDINPMAVQLGRLSLWLATLSNDKPLTFLDHHLRVGNSIAGTTLETVLRRPPSGRGGRSQPARLPLFDLNRAEQDLQEVVAPRLSLAEDPGDTIEQVRLKERILAALHKSGAPLTAWKSVCDLWCAAWFREAGSPPYGRAFRSLTDTLLDRDAPLTAHVAAPLLEEARAIAERLQFFHWPLEFPEVFDQRSGCPGFDAVIGNPPWDMLRGNGGAASDTGRLSAFARGSGTFSWQGDGHPNLYQLFTERALTLARRGGRIGILLPSGFATDHGCCRLRRALLDRTVLDTFVTVENRDGVFPIHRGLKFLLVTAANNGSTSVVPSRSGLRSAETLESIPDEADRLAVSLPRSVLEQLDPEQLAIPDVRTARDVDILSHTAFRFAGLSTDVGWGLRFGRELNATDDREHFGEHRGAGWLPVVEGKQIQPFAVDVAASARSISARTASRLLGSSRAFARARLAYRDVASPTNRLTLIAAIIPAGAVTTHTLFCLKTDVEEPLHYFLCGIFNSYVANYLVRMRVNTHVNVSIVEHLPVPRPALDSSEFRTIVRISARLSAVPSDLEAAAALQAAVAQLYRLSAADFEHVLSTFPLVPSAERAAALETFMRTS